MGGANCVRGLRSGVVSGWDSGWLGRATAKWAGLERVGLCEWARPRPEGQGSWWACLHEWARSLGGATTQWTGPFLR